jgi:phosphoribosyl 1,2-cyclic phosphate phosphodiesterase
VKPYEPFEAAGFTVTALKARHGTPNPYIYIISDGEKTLLYANDTGLLPEETWAYLRDSGVHFDLVSLDCTAGMDIQMGYESHMGIGRDDVTRAELSRIGATDSATRFVLHHFSHNGSRSLYDDFAPEAERMGYLTSYDGMIVEF